VCLKTVKQETLENSAPKITEGDFTNIKFQRLLCNAKVAVHTPQQFSGAELRSNASGLQVGGVVLIAW